MSEPRSAMVGLHHVQLAMPPDDEGEAVKFYGAILGLQQIEKPEELSPLGGVWFRSGELEIHIGIEEHFRPAVRAHPAFLVRGLDLLTARIEAAGYRVEHPAPMEGFERVYVRDPFGNRVELMEPA